MIVPLFIGSGQRVKLIEGFSKGMPSVSTSIGAEGLAINNEENILIADTAESFKDAIIRFNDLRLRETIGKNARITYEENYSLTAIKGKLISALSEIV